MYVHKTNKKRGKESYLSMKNVKITLLDKNQKIKRNVQFFLEKKDFSFVFLVIWDSCF